MKILEFKSSEKKKKSKCHTGDKEPPDSFSKQRLPEFPLSVSEVGRQCLPVYLRTFESHAPTFDRFILVQGEESSIMGLFILQTANWRLRFLWRGGAEIQVRMPLPPCNSKTTGSENQWRKQAFLPSLSGVRGKMAIP